MTHSSTSTKSYTNNGHPYSSYYIPPLLKMDIIFLVSWFLINYACAFTWVIADDIFILSRVCLIWSWFFWVILVQYKGRCAVSWPICIVIFDREVVFYQHPITIPSDSDWVWWRQFSLLGINHIWAGLLSPGEQGVWRGLWRGFNQQPSRSQDNVCHVACLWLGCCKLIYSPSYYHITTCDIGVIEEHDLFFGHDWLSMWIENQLQFANCMILIENCYKLLKLKSTY